MERTLTPLTSVCKRRCKLALRLTSRHRACALGSTAAAQLLLGKGAGVNYADASGDTPL